MSKHTAQELKQFQAMSLDENDVWKPNKQGLRMRHCIEVLNGLYGEGFIKI